MPIYDYICQKCRHVFEVRHRMTFDGEVLCPACTGNETTKLISAPASVLDWRQSESVHNSTRFRPSVHHPALRRQEVGNG
jgi:putative FmdB family regulatory protein